jgi:uncharacterized protein with NRDE domain
MCTLTYIPVHQQDFIFTTNRDEKPGRIALYPDHYTIGNYKMLFPKDSEASGTWMLIHEKNYSLCLLNGAFEKHEHKPPYRKSRGLVVLEYAQYKNTVDFVKHYNFQGIEPFTLVIINYDKERNLEEVRWDASSIHYRKLDAQKAAIWSSATLYSSEIADKRKEWFANWQQQNKVNADSVLDFHRNAGEGDPENDLMMKRENGIQTLSTTQIRKIDQQIEMHYVDYLKGKKEEFVFDYKVEMNSL